MNYANVQPGYFKANVIQKNNAKMELASVLACFISVTWNISLLNQKCFLYWVFFFYCETQFLLRLSDFP